MEEHLVRLKELQERVRKFAASADLWKKRALEAEKRNSESSERLAFLEEEYKKLNNQLKIHNLATLIHDSDQEELKKNIAAMIRDIDVCLEMLDE
jgi:valyl-tRNA synthetase